MDNASSLHVHYFHSTHLPETQTHKLMHGCLCEGVAGAITPVPGGVGQMTIAMLLKNTLESAQRA